MQGTIRRRLAEVLAVVVGVAVVAPAGSAWAGTGAVQGGVVTYDATVGQDNPITVHVLSSSSVSITDNAPGVSMAGGAGCVPAGSVLVCTGSTTITTAVVHAGDGDDTVSGDSGLDLHLDGGLGTDTLTGADGNDILVGGGGADHVDGGAGVDDITVDGCGDIAFGGDGADTFRLVGGGAQIDGGAGDDRFVTAPLGCPSDGNDIHGGTGTDLFDNSATTGSPGWPTDVAAVVALNDVADDGPVTGMPWNIHSDVESVVGGSETDYLAGDGAANVLDGGSGDDVLDGGAGPDTIVGGAGEDVVDYSARTAPITVNLAIGGNTSGETGEHDTITGIEDVWGGAGNDTLTGDAADNVLDGGDGADMMTGGAGQDIVDYSSRSAAISADLGGSAGNDGQAGEADTIAADVEGLVGGSGSDTLTGSTGDGLLIGGPGDDTLSDPGGHDLLEGDGGSDRIAARDGAIDTISCGGDADNVTADATDAVDGDCESVLRQDPAAPKTSLRAPDTRLLTSVPSFVSNSTTQQITFAATVEGSTFQCTLDTVTTACQSPFVMRNLAEGRHVVTVRAVGSNGLADPTPVSVSFLVDLTAPALTVTLPRGGCIARSGSTVRVAAKDAGGIRWLEAGFHARRLVGLQQSVIRVPVTARALGRTHRRRLRIRGVDNAGNAAVLGVTLHVCATKNRARPKVPAARPG